jgi:hypothetical protein
VIDCTIPQFIEFTPHTITSEGHVHPPGVKREIMIKEEAPVPNKMTAWSPPIGYLHDLRQRLRVVEAHPR